MNLFSWTKRKEKKYQRSERVAFNILCIRFPDGVQPDVAIEIRDMLNESDADEWQFVNHTMFFSFFKLNTSGRERAEKLMKNLKKYSDVHTELGMRTAAAEGLLVVGYDDRDQICFGPTGMAMNEAMEKVCKEPSND